MGLDCRTINDAEARFSAFDEFWLRFGAFGRFYGADREFSSRPAQVPRSHPFCHDTLVEHPLILA